TSREGEWAHDVAVLYARLGDKDRAFSWLERAYASRTFELLFLEVGPEWDNLRGDPRFEDLLRRIRSRRRKGLRSRPRAACLGRERSSRSAPEHGGGRRERRSIASAARPLSPARAARPGTGGAGRPSSARRRGRLPR